MKVTALKASAGLSLAFLAVYGGCNWVASHRPNVGTWYFAWERSIPFMPMMIVPYLSIDVFFVAAPFLCLERRELEVFAKRVVAASLVAGVVFLAMPLQFAFARPEVHGWIRPLYSVFGAVDRPFNLFPSLHIALGAILADIYARHTSGRLRIALLAWFALIAVSTVLTYQHHVVDVVGGLVLAVLVFYGVSGSPSGRPSARSLRVAMYYLAAAGGFAGVAVVAWPAGGLLLWPTVGLVIVASAYLGLGPAVFRKTGGAIAPAARLVLGPCLAGQAISLAYYRRRCAGLHHITPGVLIGGRLSEREASATVDRGVTAVLDLTAEFTEARAFRRVVYRNIPILDLTAPTVMQLTEAVAFIADQSTRGVVYVHCKAGYSRSAAAVGAYLLASGRARSADEAVAILRRARPSMVVRPEASRVLARFEATLGVPQLQEPASQVKESAPRPMLCAAVALALAAVTRLFCGISVRWIGCQPHARQRIYFANHSSHLDFLVLWLSLPAEVRARTRPVAGSDYWARNRFRRYLARRVFHAVLIDRGHWGARVDRAARVSAAYRNVRRTARALGANRSLILFPEGTRGQGLEIAPFKSGLYHVCRLRPDVELVPAYLENLSRILPKGEALPVPLIGSVTFGRPIRLEPEEDKEAFLARARGALMRLQCRSIPSSTAMSRA
jgi:1-acyl-sn-glycerol-3-phosphate acyltransferase/membrane-associated phospholipid phosphatase/predicted protein tyrosine phosphatase